MKILHLISDDKFIDSHINRFNSAEFQNTFLYLKENSTYKGKNKESINYIKPFSEEYNSFIKESKLYDCIITNGLGYLQSVFINRLASSTKIFWCFFGTEIYSNPKIWRKEYLFSSETLKIISNNRLYFLTQKIYHLRFFFKNGRGIYAEAKKAISKCDYFVWYIEEEYQMLKDLVTIKLPEFIFLPIIDGNTNLSKKYSKKNMILLGNSGSESNNHIDALKIFHEIPCGYEIKIPFSYGLKTWYKREIFKVLKRYSELKILLLTDFVPYDQYILNFEEAKAAVYPSYRQMGVGNIVMCIRSGVKIYLSERNPVYQWLNISGLKIYSIENDLKKDILSKELELTEDLIINNKNAWEGLARRQNLDEFVHILKNCMKNK